MIGEGKCSDPGYTEVFDQTIVALAVKECDDGQVILIGRGISCAVAEGVAFTAVILCVHI